MTSENHPLLSEVLPEVANELIALLQARGEDVLVEQVATLRVLERCRCGDSICATVYTAPRPALGSDHRTLNLDAQAGFFIVDVVDGEITDLEILYRDEIRQKLLCLLP